jgi:hypothetical protein
LHHQGLSTFEIRVFDQVLKEGLELEVETDPSEILLIVWKGVIGTDRRVNG